MTNMALTVQEPMPISNVVLLGLGTVFVGLVCIVFLCMIMGKVVGLLEGKKKETALPSLSSADVKAEQANVIPNRGELVAAISCCLAEELGTDVSAIRILSLKKL